MKKGVRIGVFTPSKNTRDGENTVRSYFGFVIPAISVDNLSGIKVEDYDVIMIEEAQWFDDLASFFEKEETRKSKCRFYVSGLIADICQRKYG